MNELQFTLFPQPDYACNEAINTLCTNLTFAGNDKRILLFTSHKPGEGKSFLSMHTMRNMAKLGYRVVLVDADLRRSVINSHYGVRMASSTNYGVSHYLAGRCALEDAIYETNIPGAWFMPVGQVVSNSLSLLNTSRLSEMLGHLKNNFDYVLVDAPPVGTVVDAAVIAKFCDGVLLAVGYNKTNRKELVDAKHQLARSGCEILGAVLNQVDLDKLSAKKYYYKSYYTKEYYTSSDSAKTKKTKKPSLFKSFKKKKRKH